MGGKPSKETGYFLVRHFGSAEVPHDSQVLETALLGFEKIRARSAPVSTGCVNACVLSISVMRVTGEPHFSVLPTTHSKAQCCCVEGTCSVDVCACTCACVYVVCCRCVCVTGCVCGGCKSVTKEQRHQHLPLSLPLDPFSQQRSLSPCLPMEFSCSMRSTSNQSRYELFFFVVCVRACVCRGWRVWYIYLPCVSCSHTHSLSLSRHVSSVCVKHSPCI